MLIILVLGASYLFVREFNRSGLQTERDRITVAALAQAKEAVLGYALANQSVPGGLPFPDRSATDGNYDGNGDCVTYGFNDSHLLGKLPILSDQGCGAPSPAFDADPRDATAERLWYAVSKNLVKSNGGTYLKITTSALAANGNWLTVSDETGAPLSNRVAFVLIAPGAVLQGQNRSAAAPSAQNFLDDFTVGAATYQNWNMFNALGFVAANPVTSAANRFNDRLLYVTRDEFMSRLVDRVAGEIRFGLTTFYQANGTYPGVFAPIVASLPAWFDPHWTGDTVYTFVNQNQATIQFQGCVGTTFTFIWNVATNKSDMLRNGPC